MTPGDEPVKYARKSCLPCRRSKRRCDRKVPFCDLCLRKEVECIYPVRHEGNQAVPESHHPLGSFSSDGSSRFHEHALAHASDFLLQSPLDESYANAIYFIAPQIFQQARLDLPRLNLASAVDPRISSLVGDVSMIRGIAASYFTTIHRWLPIVSKQGFFSHLLNPMAQRQTELNLLVLCMKLCSTASLDESGNGGAKTTLYRITKRLHQEAEVAHILSIHVLQAGVLLAFYELSQALYPAAYLNVAACARYGLAFEIDKACQNKMGDSDGTRTWNEIEEKRRVWWAVIMFDR